MRSFLNHSAESVPVRRGQVIVGVSARRIFEKEASLGYEPDQTTGIGIHQGLDGSMSTNAVAVNLNTNDNKSVY